MNKVMMPYHSQKNNKYYPNASCGTTCVANALNALSQVFTPNKDWVKDDDGIWEQINSPEFINFFLERANIPNTWKRVYLRYRAKTRFTYLNNSIHALGLLILYLTQNDITHEIRYFSDDEFLNMQYPTLFILPTELTSSGHYVLVYGTEYGSFCYQDPWFGPEKRMDIKDFKKQIKASEQGKWKVQDNKIFAMRLNINERLLPL